MRKLAISLLVVLAFCAGWWLNPRPDIGMGIYFEDGRLIADGGGHTFNGNFVDITLPDWIKGTLGDEPFRNSTVRNFHFDSTDDVVVLPEPNRTIVVHEINSKTFVDANETTESNEPNEYVDIAITCACGNKISVKHPVTDDLWPLRYACNKCDMHYIMYRDDVMDRMVQK